MTILLFMAVVKRSGEPVAVEERPPVPSENSLSVGVMARGRLFRSSAKRTIL